MEGYTCCQRSQAPRECSLAWVDLVRRAEGSSNVGRRAPASLAQPSLRTQHAAPARTAVDPPQRGPPESPSDPVAQERSLPSSLEALRSGWRDSSPAPSLRPCGTKCTPLPHKTTLALLPSQRPVHTLVLLAWGVLRGPPLDGGGGAVESWGLGPGCERRVRPDLELVAGVLAGLARVREWQETKRRAPQVAFFEATCLSLLRSPRAQLSSELGSDPLLQVRLECGVDGQAADLFSS